MLKKSELLQENAALVALLRTIDNSRDTWSSIAEKVVRQGRAIQVFEHELDPQHHRLDDPDENDEYGDRTQMMLLEEDDVPVTTQRRVQLLQAHKEAEALVHNWEKQGLDMVSVLDERYPLSLREVVDMPPFLFSKGRFLSPNQQDLGVSVVGSRNAGPEALHFASDVATMLVSKGLTVIAGLALGVDAEAHHRALQEHGRTVAFIGTGIGKYYPAKNRHLQELIEHNGQVFSQFWPWQGPTKWTFPARNATMSGYGIATVIVEAHEYSGTRVQARQAQHHGRPIIIRDVVVDHTEWGNRLAHKPNVYVVSNVDDVARAINSIQKVNGELQVAINGLIAQASAYAKRVLLV